MPRDSKRTHNQVRRLYIRADANYKIVPVRENIDISVACVERDFDVRVVRQETCDCACSEYLREIGRAAHAHASARHSKRVLDYSSRVLGLCHQSTAAFIVALAKLSNL